jgi:hypothetical protein
VFTIGAVVLVERLGRKPLMVFGTTVMSVALVGLGVIFVPPVTAMLSEVYDSYSGFSFIFFVLILLGYFLSTFELLNSHLALWA